MYVGPGVITMGKSARFVCPGAAAPVGIPGTLPTMTMDEALVAFLKDYHTGEANSISSRELERIYGVRGTTIRQMVNRLRTKGVPICSCDIGYYYAETEDEVSRTIRQLRSRIAKIAEAERGLTKSIQVLPNQMVISANPSSTQNNSC